MTMPASGGRLVDVDGQELFMAVDGPADAPWLVFSNSLATDLHLWDMQVEALAKNWRILRYDYRGHGRSAPPIAPVCGIAELKRDLFGLMDFAGVDRAHHVGVSMGSVAGAAAALEQPHRFASLTICNCRLKSSEAAARDLSARAGRVLADGMQSLVDFTLVKWFGGSRLPLDDSARRKIAAMIAATQTEGFAAYARGMQGYDVEAILAQHAIPISILIGSGDGPTASYLRELDADRPRVTFSSIEGAGHLPNIHAAIDFNAALATFLNDARTQAG